MYNIALIYPLKFNKFYINPFYLQKIYTMIYTANFSHNIFFQLLDINTEQYYQILHTEHFKLAIIDTPEGGTNSLRDALNIINADAVLLIGDLIKYGQSKELLEYLNNLYPFPIYGCLDDFAIIDFIKIILLNDKKNEISGLMYFNNNKFIQNRLDEKHQNIEKMQLLFPEHIIKTYENKGIQIFMDGLSRGCENNCSFCKLNNNLFLKNRNNSSQIDVVKTIEMLRKRIKKTLFIQFTDENFFGGGISRLKQIIELSHELSKINFNGILGVDTRLDTIYNSNNSNSHNEIRQEAWIKLCRCGLRYCFLGLETFSKSQAFRYNKNLNLSSFEDAIYFLKDMGITYTIGLILWDPMMKKSELIENLDFIKNHGLLGQTASLLKIMRIQANSQYRKKYSESIENNLSDYFNIDNESIIYKDSEIRKILPFVKIVYYLFNNSGYRHSDVALFSVLYDENTPKIFKIIPYEISKLEYDILRYLLQLNDFSNRKEILRMIFIRCKSTITKINKLLEQIEIINSNLKSIKDYYDNVFCKIHLNLINIIEETLIN